MKTILLNDSIITDSNDTIERIKTLFHGVEAIELNPNGISFRDYSKLVYVNELELEIEENFNDALANASDEYYLGFDALDTEESYRDFLIECREDRLKNIKTFDTKDTTKKVVKTPAQSKNKVTSLVKGIKAVYHYVFTILVIQYFLKKYSKGKNMTALSLYKALEGLEVTYKDIAGYYCITPSNCSKYLKNKDYRYVALQTEMKVKILLEEFHSKIVYLEFGETKKAKALDIEKGTFKQLSPYGLPMQELEVKALSSLQKEHLKKYGVYWVKN